MNSRVCPECRRVRLPWIIRCEGRRSNGNRLGAICVAIDPERMDLRRRPRFFGIPTTSNDQSRISTRVQLIVHFVFPVVRARGSQ